MIARGFNWMDRTLGRLFYLACAGAFGTGGTLAVWHALDQFHMAWAATQWPAANGRVVASKLEGGDRARVEYEFFVAGERYRGRRVHVGEYSGIERAAQRIARSYPAGKEVSVYHHPTEPGLAVLERRFPWVSLILLGMGVGLLWAAWICMRQRRGLLETLARAADCDDD